MHHPSRQAQAQFALYARTYSLHYKLLLIVVWASCSPARQWHWMPAEPHRMWTAGNTCSTVYAKNRVLILGQFISVLIACTGIFSQLLNGSYQIQIPVTQSAGVYLLLCAYLVDPILRFRWQQNYTLEIPWWHYLLLAFADVEGNYLVVCAYKYTTISSVMLLDCFTIPIVMLLSTIFLQAKFTRSHYVAVLFCLVGIIVLVISDVIRDEETMLKASWNVSALYGDFLCLFGSAVYACSNIGQEYLVKKDNRRMEFLGLVGFFGLLISSMQAAYFEGDVVRAVEWTWSSIFCLFGYIITLFVMYTLTSIFLTTGDATVFNLSLLTSDVFAVLAAKLLFSEKIRSLYFVGFMLIITGVTIYNRSAPPTTPITVDPFDIQNGSYDSLLPR